MGHDSINATKETLIFFDDKELIAASTKSSDSLAQILRKDLQRAVCILATDENLTHLYVNNNEVRKDDDRLDHLPLVLPLIIF